MNEMTSPAKMVFPQEISGMRTMQEQFEPYAWYAEMRANQPVYYDEQQQVWNVFRYKDVERVLSDYKLFSSNNTRKIAGSLEISDAPGLTSMDPPQHTQRRALMWRAFTPRSLQDWEPRIHGVTRYLLDQIEGQQVRIMQDIANPMPVTVIADLLGVPAADWKQFKQWSDILIMPGSPETFEQITAMKEHALQEMREYLFPIVEQKRREPQGDIISDLTQAVYEGDRLTDRDILDISISLLFAGNITTAMLIFTMFYSMLADRPGTYAELRQNPELIDQTVEEVLRFRPSAQVLMRTVQEDTDIFGVPMKKGDAILAWIGSANRDEEEFANAHQFDIHRPNNAKHLSFGKGAHFCLGAPLSRLEARIVLREFIKRYETIAPAGFAADIVISVS